MTDPQIYSVPYRIALISISVLFCFLMAGIVFGYSPLKNVMLSSGVFRDLCKNNKDQSTHCNEQKNALDLIFTIAASATNISALFIGTVTCVVS